MPSSNQPIFPRVDDRVLEQHRRNLARLYTFLHRYLAKTMTYAHTSVYALGLFSSDSILLDLFANEEYILDQLHQNGIYASAIWQDSGRNAVSEGLKNWKSMRSVGDENEHPVLKNYAIYFSPISMLSVYEPYEQMEHCGLAIIIPRQYAWDDYLTMIVGIAHDMMITLQFNNIATMYYERSGKGLLSIDNMMSRHGEALATYYNQELFDLLGVAPIDMYYRPAELLIDPLPANQELWDIVKHHRTIHNQPLTVTCRGKDVSLIVSTDAYNQPSINAHGVVFYFTTQQKLTAKLARKVANGAIKTFDDIIGNNKNLTAILKRARQMALTDSNILILGESGTGKDVLAQAIHNASSRRDKPFIAINCGAMPKDLIESELFGYDSGAFTGARKNGNIGKFELASGGTIFLDEIGEMPLDLQAKLLRVVEQKQLMRLGSSQMIDVDVKIIAATNANIWSMIEQKQFRADLFYRISTMQLNLIPLRERKDDIIPLAKYFIRRVSERVGKDNIMRLSPEAQELLTNLEWRGNVRELQNLMECIVQLYPGDLILPQYILDNISGYQRPGGQRPSAGEMPVSYVPPLTSGPYPPIINPTPPDKSIIHQPEGYVRDCGMGTPYSMPRKPSALSREEILSALETCGGNRSKAAQYLGISRRTFYRRLEKLGL